MSNILVPRRAERLLESLGANTDFREAVMGDLAEEFALRASLDGERAARRWYRRESLRVAPHLLRDWWRGLGRSDVGYFARAIVGATVAVAVFESALSLSMIWLGVYEGLFTRLAKDGSFMLPAWMLMWTVLDGVFAGYVAARLGSRAPLATVVAMAAIWGGVLYPINLAINRMWPPLWFVVLNGTLVLVGLMLGGMLEALRSRERRETVSAG